MIDTRREITYPINALVKNLPVKRSKSTIRRWITEGFVFGNRTKKRAIRLEHCLIGGVIHSSLEAYQRFVDACTEAGSKE